MMTSACLLEEAMSSKDDVSNISRQLSGNSNDDISSKQQIQRREVADEDRTVMMTSAVMSSQSTVDKKHKSYISDDDVNSDVITISSRQEALELDQR
ncbi:ABC transporter C family member 12-like [Dorcoceras hygrometricum]|uniref:ABC transporter C family member 12-like n=1 Tax=Dorcoceras hygrometricum TaxID=472368 RepID=A0A2Z7DF57_9LAMI|nr:ABC transporter C family member 12-like [Dorcoceras hygrometricum]